LVKQLLERTGRRHASDAGLAARAAALADHYLDGIRPSSIRWSSRQQRRWGSCSLHSREIRIASRLQTVPEWVLDGVIVHELAHLLEAGHTARFHEIANRYPRQGEAHTYLDGFGHGLTTAGFLVSAEEDDAPEEAAADHVAACAW
jgi:predicted metal-dependent hydrolase